MGHNNDKPSVLFVCVGNAGKSQMAGALMRQQAGDTVTVHTAGTSPKSELNSESVAAMDEVGAPIEGEHPKPVDPSLLDSVDVVVILGDAAELPSDGSAPVERWSTPEPTEQDIHGMERMRIIRDDIADRVTTLFVELA